MQASVIPAVLHHAWQAVGPAQTLASRHRIVLRLEGVPSNGIMLFNCFFYHQVLLSIEGSHP